MSYHKYNFPKVCTISELTLHTYDGYIKEGDNSQTNLFNGNSDEGYCMTTKMARVISVYLHVPDLHIYSSHDI